MRACSVSGTSSASTSPVEPVRRALLHEQAAVEQHPHGLDRVQRDAFGAGEDAIADVGRKPRHEAGEQLLHRLLRERLQVAAT